MEHIKWADFQKVDIRVGTIVALDDWANAQRYSAGLTPHGLLARS